MADVEELLSELESPENERVQKALYELSTCGDEAIIPAVAKTARIKSHYEAAVGALRQFGDERTLAVLIDLLDAEDPELCAGYEVVLFDTIMERAILDIGEKAVDPLLEELKSEDHETRRRAGVILCSFSRDDILPALISALEAEQNVVNQVIFKNLIEKLGG